MLDIFNPIVTIVGCTTAIAVAIKVARKEVTSMFDDVTGLYVDCCGILAKRKAELAAQQHPAMMTSSNVTQAVGCSCNKKIGTATRMNHGAHLNVSVMINKLLTCDEVKRANAPRLKALKLLIRYEASSRDRQELLGWMEHAFTETGFPRTGHDHLRT